HPPVVVLPVAPHAGRLELLPVGRLLLPDRDPLHFLVVILAVVVDFLLDDPIPRITAHGGRDALAAGLEQRRLLRARHHAVVAPRLERLLDELARRLLRGDDFGGRRDRPHETCHLLARCERDARAVLRRLVACDFGSRRHDTLTCSPRSITSPSITIGSSVGTFGMQWFAWRSARASSRLNCGGGGGRMMRYRSGMLVGSAGRTVTAPLI